MNFVSKLVAGLALAFGMAAPASALVLTAGDFKITINAFDGGTTGYTGNGEVCGSVAACDAAAGTPAPGSFGSEDTWGIFSVQSISYIKDGSLFFTAGQGGEYLTGIFGGVKDTYVEVNGTRSPTTLALGTGGWLNMYLTKKNYDSSAGPTARTAVNAYKGITDVGGTLVLSADFGKGVLEDDPEFTFVTNFANKSISGGSQAFLDVTGGLWGHKFNTNAQKDLNGGLHDLFMKVTFGQTGASLAAGWTVDASGDVLSKVPEPGSLALLGLGLAGLALLRRRRA